MAGAWKTKRIRSWAEFERLTHAKDRKWVFRGQADARHGLSTSLGRAFEALRPILETTKERSGKIDRQSHEEYLVRNFQKNAHLYVGTLPPSTDRESWLEWLSIMQHHGCPTRLLDVTYSPNVAAYFALESGTGDCCMFAFHHGRLDQEAESGPENLFPGTSRSECFIRTFTPKFSNQREMLQQATFLVPSTIGMSFDEILEMYEADVCVKYVIPKDLRYRGLVRLRHQNISAATLFPGVDGYCRSLRHQILETTRSLERRFPEPC